MVSFECMPIHTNSKVACRAPQVKAIGIGGVAFVIPVPLETDAGTISRMIVLVLVKRGELLPIVVSQRVSFKGK